MEDFSSTGQLVTLCLVDSSIGAVAKGLALVDVEALVAKDMLMSLKRSMGHCIGLALRITPIESEQRQISNEASHDTMVMIMIPYHILWLMNNENNSVNSPSFLVAS